MEKKLFVRITVTHTLNPVSSLIKLTERCGAFGKEQAGTFEPRE